MTLACKILLVDDHDDIRRLVATALGNEGYRVEVAKDALKARRAIARGRYDLVIADVALPRGEDGISLVAHAREQGCGVLLISGSYAAEERLKGSGLTYLMKPFRVASFLAAVQNVLAARFAERGAVPATEEPPLRRLTG
ncbi:MAG TPA: response regulator [Stellaceae bacterium]|jgi:two-component system phosphate regulon response regulator OmpR